MLPDAKMYALPSRPQTKSGVKPLPVVIIGELSPASVTLFSRALVASDLLSSAFVPCALTETRNAQLRFLHPFLDSQIFCF